MEPSIKILDNCISMYLIKIFVLLHQLCTRPDSEVRRNWKKKEKK